MAAEACLATTGVLRFGGLVSSGSTAADGAGVGNRPESLDYGEGCTGDDDSFPDNEVAADDAEGNNDADDAVRCSVPVASGAGAAVVAERNADSALHRGAGR